MQYRSMDEIKDNREFVFGDVWKVRDNLVRLVPSDRIENYRTIHPCRLVVVTQDIEEMNNNENNPNIRIAPLSTKVQFGGELDVFIKAGDGVKYDSILQLQLAQPILKKDLFKQVGSLSEDKQFEIRVLEAKIAGLDIFDEEEE